MSEHDLEEPDFNLVSKPFGYGGGTYMAVIENSFVRRTFLFMVKNSGIFRFYMLCACCDKDGPFIPDYSGEDDRIYRTVTVCRGCKASICDGCTRFVEQYKCAKKKRCRYCGTHVAPLCKISLNGPQPLSFVEWRKARNRFYTFPRWVSSVRVKDRNFDFSKIFWKKYFDHLNWRFYVDAERFFDQQLPGQLKIVIAGMYHNGSPLLTMEFRKGFAGPYHDFHKDQDEDQPPNFIFRESMIILVMHSFAFKMLEKMKVKVCYLDSIRRRLRTFWRRELSIGLGIDIPEVKKPQDDLSFWH